MERKMSEKEKLVNYLASHKQEHSMTELSKKFGMNYLEVTHILKLRLYQNLGGGVWSS
jgi:hypothetical protein